MRTEFPSQPLLYDFSVNTFILVLFDNAFIVIRVVG